MANGNGETLKYRVGKIEEGQDKVDEKVDKLLTNHIPHIYTELQAIKGITESNSKEINSLRKSMWALGTVIISLFAIALVIVQSQSSL